jgi:hypothetical protein
MLKYLLAVPAEPKKLAARSDLPRKSTVPAGSKPVGMNSTIVTHSPGATMICVSLAAFRA